MTSFFSAPISVSSGYYPQPYSDKHEYIAGNGPKKARLRRFCAGTETPTIDIQATHSGLRKQNDKYEQQYNCQQSSSR
jgi:hypothetical protein